MRTLIISFFILFSTYAFNAFIFFRFNIFGEELTSEYRDEFYNLLGEQFLMMNQFFLIFSAFIIFGVIIKKTLFHFKSKEIKKEKKEITQIIKIKKSA